MTFWIVLFYFVGMFLTFIAAAVSDPGGWADKFSDGELGAVILFWPPFWIKTLVCGIGTAIGLLFFGPASRR